MTETLRECIAQRDAASKSCLELIAALEELANRFKRAILHSGAVDSEEMAEASVAGVRAVIKKARTGKP